MLIWDDSSCGGAEVEISVLPSTADDSSSQYVRVTLVAKLQLGYPDLPPDVTIKNPRGLDESVVKIIESEIENKISMMAGEPVLFELIEVVREHLTEQNLPSCPCVICLYGFNGDDEFIKTECYHYFHSHCLWRHILASKRIHDEEQEKLPTWQRTNSFQVCLYIYNLLIFFLVSASMSGVSGSDDSGHGHPFQRVAAG